MAESSPTSFQDRSRAILAIGLPIIGGMISQNVVNLVDTAMVGHLGDASLAAVGTGSFANFMAMAFIMGLSSGVQAMAARRKGEGRENDLAVPLNGALLIAAALSIPWSVVVYWLAPFMIDALNPDPEVVGIGSEYLQARIIGMTAIGMNFAFRGYWNAVNLSKLYLRTLLVMHAANIFLNWVFIFGKFGFEPMGAVGAGLGSAISTYVGTAYYTLMGVQHARKAGFLRGLPDMETVKTMIRLAVPNGVQQFAFAAGLTALFWIIGQVGTQETAAAHVLINVSLVAILPGLGLGLSATSLVGQALGRQDVDDARRWGWDVVKIAVLVMGFLGLIMLTASGPILSIFLKDSSTLEVARPPLMVLGAMISIDAVGMVLGNSLLGAGASKQVMVVSMITQWGLFLPVAYLVGPVLGLGLTAIWISQGGYRLIQAVIFAGIWQKGNWAEIKV